MSRGYRSLFWPIVLIGVGVIWLLSNLNLIPTVTIEGLLHLWPILLIVIGLDMLIGRRSSWLGGLIGLGAIGLVIFILAFGPSLGFNMAAPTMTQRVTEPLGTAQSAQVSLWLSERPTILRALSDSNALIDATVTYEGVLHFDVSGTTDKIVSLRRDRQDNFSLSADGTSWQIGLTTAIPLDLAVDGGSGSADLDLSLLDLKHLRLDAGSGMMTVSLPASKQPYEAEIEGGSGSLNINLAPDADVRLRFDTGSGMIGVHVPRGAAVRVEIQDSGSGIATLRAGLERVNGTGDEGVWQTPGYSTAAHKIEIVVTDFGSGNFDVR
jgi:hypothetical protein